MKIQEQAYMYLKINIPNELNEENLGIGELLLKKKVCEDTHISLQVLVDESAAQVNYIIFFTDTSKT